MVRPGPLLKPPRPKRHTRDAPCGALGDLKDLGDLVALSSSQPRKYRLLNVEWPPPNLAALTRALTTGSVLCPLVAQEERLRVAAGGVAWDAEAIPEGEEGGGEVEAEPSADSSNDSSVFTHSCVIHT